MPAITSINTLIPSAWEAAYLRFETPEQEIEKFVDRLAHLGANRWPRDAHVVELFCGRGNGLRAFARLGFANIEGIDLSPALAAQYAGPGRVLVGDCRKLPYADECKDVLIVQGGLHHLPVLPGDLEATLAEARRVLRPGGLFCAVEPWLTPFLSIVHTICKNPVARSVSGKLYALATMI
jgi:SAM-dependent methyltransferase